MGVRQIARFLSKELLMMRTAMWMAVSVMTLSLVGCGGGEPGGASPEEVMQKANQALADGDQATFAQCLPPKEGDNADNQTIASMFMSMDRIGGLLDQANEKYGQQKVQSALGMAGMMLKAMDPPDLGKIASEGELTKDGDKATYKLESEGGGPMGGTSTRTIGLTQKDGRWFFDPSSSGKQMPTGENLAKAEKAVTDFVAAFEKAISDHGDAQGFGQALQGEMKKFTQAMQAASS
jgi:hypothetical protein